MYKSGRYGIFNLKNALRRQRAMSMIFFVCPCGLCARETMLVKINETR